MAAIAKFGKKLLRSKNKDYQHHSSSDDNKEIERRMKQEYEKNSRTIRIMLLGPGDSGKTTILKQMKKINNQCEDSEVRCVMPYIRTSAVSYMRILCQQSVLLKDKCDEETTVNPKLENLRREILEMKSPYDLTPDLAVKIKALWSDEGLQNTLKNRALYQIHDNVDYFLNAIERIAAKQYTPTWEDYVRIRMRSTGFSQTKMTTKIANSGEHTFEFTDVGGQRSERQKWMRFISEDIHAACYVVAVSEYDLLLMEDNETCRLHEAIDLFSQIMTKGDFFANKSVLLFLNKYDLFVEKIKKVPITVAFPDFPEDKMNPHDADDVIKFISMKFLEVLESHNITLKAPLHILRTTALQTHHIDKVFRSIMHNLVTQDMKSYGLM